MRRLPVNTDEIVRAGEPFLSGRKSILDVGCGDGSLVLRLRDLGFEAIGIDKSDPNCAFCSQCALEEYVPKESFDVVTARLSLHHTENLTTALRCVRDLLFRGGIFVIQEFAWEDIDVETINWVRHRLDPPGPEPKTIDFRDGDANAVLRRWRDAYGDLHSFASIAQCAGQFFELLHAEVVPYFSWLMDRPDCLEIERAAIDEDRIRALGRICVMQRLHEAGPAVERLSGSAALEERLKNNVI